MSNDRKGPASRGWLDQSVPVLPAEGCPAWCTGRHQADDRDAAFHACIVAERDGASVALSCIDYHDPAQTGNTVIILNVDAESEPIELADTGLADRLCLALGDRLDADVWTAHQAWVTDGRIRQIR